MPGGRRILELRNVSKTFSIPAVRRDTVREHVLDFFRPHAQETLTVLRDVSFAIESGETVGIMGRNGCGKSTLLRVAAGIDRPNGGTVTIRAPITPILELGIGWNPELNAVDNIYLLGSVLGLSLRQIKSSIEEILAFAGLERFANLELRHYSSGMASRLAYSVAFRAVKEILILDEIFSVGDAGFTERCEARYRELHAAGHTTLIVSHDPRIITTFCDRALLLEGGRIVMEGTGQEVSSAYVRLFAGAGA